MLKKFVHALAALLLLGSVAAPVVAQAPAGYYNSVDTSSGSALRSTLHNVIDDHQRFPYTSSSTDVWDILNAADQNPNNSGQIIDIYKNAAYNKISGGVGAYNREHSWPKSLGFPDDGSSNYPYTDCHHLFASDASYNSSRGNKVFGNCNGCTERTTNYTNGRGGGSGVYPGNSNWTGGDYWQTWSGRKGDVARAMFYMDLRYEGGNHGGTGVAEPDLRLTDNLSLIESYNTGNNEAVAYMGLLSTLLQWHADDPVDSYEVSRNNVIYGYQGNRNPFIDNPGWVACIYQGTGCGGGGGGGGGNALSNGVAKTGLSGGSGSQTFYTMNVPAGSTGLSFQMSGGSGDADLYVRFGSEPSTSSYDCRPYLNGNNETCSFASPSTGTYHVLVRGYSAYSGVSLVGSYTAGGGGGGGSCGDSATASNLSGSQGQWRNYEFAVDSCADQAVFKISGGSGDADLYTRFGSLPTLSSYSCRPWLTGNNETCTHDNPSAGTWRVSIYGYAAYSGVKLESSYE